MRKFLIVSFLILLFIPYISINAQYGGFNDSPFKEGALVTAVKTGRLQDLVSALNSGASINERDFDEVPALLLAIERSRIDMTLFLLEYDNPLTPALGRCSLSVIILERIARSSREGGRYSKN